ncbi:hypothetical protein JB92DRAFT_3106226 [Gautieria morchelliformis]|nr:hypothetical protein JB92DRAFT_3106226 [Gautieria morchelliformis]
MLVDPIVQMTNVQMLPLPALTALCSQLEVSVSAKVPSRASCATLLVPHFRACCCKLELVVTEDILADVHLSFPDQSVPVSRHDKLVFLLNSVYSTDFITEMFRPSALRDHARTKVLRTERKLRKLDDSTVRSAAADLAGWPKVIPNNMILSCCHDYYNVTTWSPPPMCASCGRRSSSRTFDFITTHGLLAPCNLELLRLTYPFIITCCIVQTCSNEFMFDDEVINGLMIHRDGTQRLPDGSMNISLCPNCHSSLKVGKVPRFAFKNQQYRGQLPDEFIDLTWVEEMVILHNLAFYTGILVLMA